MSIKSIVSGMFILVLVSISIAYFSDRLRKTSITTDSKVKVVTTIYPLYQFIKEIGGSKVEVVLLIPPGIEPHAFEPKPRDILLLNEADLFVYTGPLMETWAQNLLNGVSNDKLVTVNVSKNIKLIPAEIDDVDSSPKALDPHIWLGISNVPVIIDAITEGLSAVDKNQSSYYVDNAQAYKQKIADLEKEYSSGLANCKSRIVVYGGHYTFGYLTKEFNLTYLAAQGISSESEPTIADLSRLVEMVKREKITTVFYEELSSPKVAETISEETGSRLVMLNGAHTVNRADFERGISYIEIMKDNLQNLRKGLDCK